VFSQPSRTSSSISTRVISHTLLYHLYNGVNRVYLEGSWLLYSSLEV
jgi:hypothetical protein